jgi:hypothetical protein
LIQPATNRPHLRSRGASDRYEGRLLRVLFATPCKRRFAMIELSVDARIFCWNGCCRIWSNLYHLFEEAMVSQGESKRQQLAIRLHDGHQRTADVLKARAIPTPR